MTPGSDPLISTEALAGRLGEPGLKILDGSWHLPAAARNAWAEFEAGHIPGAAFFDIDRVSDASTGLPHMLPAPEAFAEAVSALGISAGDRVVVYDAAGIFSAPRVWWMFRAMGHADVRVLNGGLPKWRAEGRALETGPAAPAPASYAARSLPELVRSLDDVRRALDAPGQQVIDARPAPRFRGEAPEPRPGLRLGHMPGAVNAPFPSVIAPDGTMLPEGALRRVFDAAGVDLQRPITASCGSGVTAGVVLLALARIGRADAALYDGSWAEWGGREDTPVVGGAAS